MAKKQSADFEDKMISAIQTAYYRKAKNLALQSALLECASEVGLDVSEFASDLASGGMKPNCKTKSAWPGAWVPHLSHRCAWSIMAEYSL